MRERCREGLGEEEGDKCRAVEVHQGVRRGDWGYICRGRYPGRGQESALGIYSSRYISTTRSGGWTGDIFITVDIQHEVRRVDWGYIHHGTYPSRGQESGLGIYSSR